MHFCPFSRTFSLLTGELVIGDLLSFFLFGLTKHLRHATYGLETCCSYLGSIKHTCTSMVKQTISTL